MIVRFYATLRPIVGGKAVEVADPAGRTVRQLLDELIGRYPDLRRRLFDDDGQLYRHVHVFVNGRDAPYLDRGLDTVLRPQDKIDVFPPVGGGEETGVGDRIDATVAAVPRWLLREYLVELGGRPTRGGRVVGDGWSARLEQVEDHRIGSLRVGRVRLELTGDRRAVADLRPLLEKRLARGGG